MPIVSPCTEGHRWQVLDEDQPVETRQVFCTVCGLIQPLTQPETVDARAGEQPTQSLSPASEKDTPGEATVSVGPLRTDATNPTLAYSHEEEALPAPGAGVQVQGFEILGVLGRGGMGVVYKARQLSLKRLVALKMVLAGAHADSYELKRFRAEAEAVAQLQHPNIVQIHEIGEHEERPFFSLEYVAGGSLSKKLAGKPLPAGEAAKLAETLARAIHHAHQHGIVHRDLKPANVLLTQDGAPKVADFGLAKRLEGDAGQTKSGAIMGTPSYMAPEQAQGRTRDIGPLVDVYALGAILYEMLTGRPPFKADSIMTTLQQVMTAEVVPPSRLQPNIPRDLETICLKAMAREPGRRYHSALALAQDLERFRAGEAILARREGWTGKVWRKVRRSPLTAAALGLLAVTVVVAVFLFRGAARTGRIADLQHRIETGLDTRDWGQSHRDQMEQWLAELDDLVPDQAASSRQRLHQRFEEYLRQLLRRPRLQPDEIKHWEKDLQWLASRFPEAIPPLQQELQQRLRGWQTVFELKPPFAELSQVFPTGLVKPNTSALVVSALPGKPASQARELITKIPCRGNLRLEASFDSWDQASEIGLLINDSPGHGQGVSALAFSPDGRLLATAGYDGSVRGWNPITGQKVFAAQDPSGAVWSLAYSPDGKTLAVGGRGAVSLIDGNTGRMHKSWTAHSQEVLALAFSANGKRLASGSGDKSAKIWDLDTFAELAVFKDHAEAVIGVAFDQSGQTLTTAARDRTVKTWNVASRKVVAALTQDAQGVPFRSLALAQDGKTVAIAGKSAIQIGNASTGSFSTSLSWALGPSLLAFSADGKFLAGADGTILKWWDLANRREHLFWALENGGATALAYSPDAGLLALGTSTGAIRLWDPAAGAARLTLGGQKYLLKLTTAPAAAKVGGAEKPLAPLSFAAARKAVVSLRVQILRGESLLREQTLPVPGGPLQLLAGRDGDQLQIQINGGKALVFFDVFPIRGSPAGVFAFYVPEGVHLLHARAACQELPTSGSLLEKGDDFYDQGKLSDALACFQEQALAAGGTEAGREARCKAGLCLLGLNRPDEAVKILEPLAIETGDRWPLVAACQVWLLRLGQNRLDDAQAFIDSISSRYRFEDLATFIPGDLRQRILKSHFIPVSDYLLFKPATLRNLEQVLALAELFHESNEAFWTKYRLVRLYYLAGQKEKALQTAKEVVAISEQPGWGFTPIWTLQQYCWLLRLGGQASLGLAEIDRRLFESPGVVRQFREEQRLFYLLFLERARLHVALNDWPGANKDLDEFFARAPADKAPFEFYAAARLLQGFVLEQLGQPSAAVECWRQGLYKNWLAKLPKELLPYQAETPINYALIDNLIMASLANDLSESEADKVFHKLVEALAGDSMPAKLAGMFKISGSLFRDMWRSDRGRLFAQRVASRSFSIADHFRIPALLMVAEKFHQDAMPGKISKEQDDILWDTVTRGFEAYAKGKLDQIQVMQLALAWKGTFNFLGWGGVAGKLDPALRGPLAYVMGHRYLRLGKPKEAATFFRTALADAPANSALRRLAQVEIDRTKVK
jgi:tetratricopeptide (TPR) repeat protein